MKSNIIYMATKKSKPKSKAKMNKKPIQEDFELSSSEDEAGVVNINEEHRMKGKDISFNCGHCGGKLLLRNSIEINPRGVKCRCNGCSFKLSRNDNTLMLVEMTTAKLN